MADRQAYRRKEIRAPEREEISNWDKTFVEKTQQVVSNFRRP